MPPDVSVVANTVSYRSIDQNNMHNLLSSRIHGIVLNVEVNESLEALIKLTFSISLSCCPIETKTESSKICNKPSNKPPQKCLLILKKCRPIISYSSRENFLKLFITVFEMF